MHRPAWTRDTRIERLNRMVMSRLPHWTAEDVARHRAEGERMAARVAELSQPSDPLSHIHDFPCFAGQCPVDHQPSDPSAKQVGTSPEHANETPESWHVTVPIFAVSDGTVLSVDGDTVLIELDDGRHLRWLHMNDIAVTAGDRVVRGQQVGTGLG